MPKTTLSPFIETDPPPRCKTLHRTMCRELGVKLWRQYVKRALKIMKIPCPRPLPVERTFLEVTVYVKSWPPMTVMISETLRIPKIIELFCNRNNVSIDWFDWFHAIKIMDVKKSFTASCVGINDGDVIEGIVRPKRGTHV